MAVVLNFNVTHQPSITFWNLMANKLNWNLSFPMAPGKGGEGRTPLCPTPPIFWPHFSHICISEEASVAPDTTTAPLATCMLTTRTKCTHGTSYQPQEHRSIRGMNQAEKCNPMSVHAYAQQSTLLRARGSQDGGCRERLWRLFVRSTLGCAVLSRRRNDCFSPGTGVRCYGTLERIICNIPYMLHLRPVLIVKRVCFLNLSQFNATEKSSQYPLKGTLTCRKLQPGQLTT